LDGRLWGTYVHGIFHNDGFRRAWLDAIRRSKGWEPYGQGYSYPRRREEAFDRLADHVRQHLAMDRIYEMIGAQSADCG
jgi:adenosylcobyric acid synthase